MKVLKGTPVSIGISKGKVFFLVEEELNILQKKLNSEVEIKEEIEKFFSALKLARTQIKQIMENTKRNLGEDKSKIFEAHISILEDPTFTNDVVEIVKKEKTNISYQFKKISDAMISTFSSLDDEYMKERAVDIRDVSSRVLKILEGKKIIDLSLIKEKVIIVAHDLTPSETSQLDPKFVVGFITEIGGKTTHTAIIAKIMEIPALVGLGEQIWTIKDNDNLLIDGYKGEVFINPSFDLEKETLQKEQKYKKIKEENANFVGKETISKDGWKSKILANIGIPKDLDSVLKYDSEGIGLFRTEFLYMDSKNWPTEEEQFAAYKQVLETMKGKIVTIRTLDIGGDKKLNYYNFPNEMNPFLGYRAIRLCLDNIQIFKTQIRALLRASSFGNLAIDIPMIATIEEFLQAKAIFKEVENDLKKQNVIIGKYKLGIMVEIPAVVELADKFIKYADFFSIGTNDLIQYSLAVDRMSEKVSYLYQPFNPSILRMLKKLIDCTTKYEKHTTICGELASEIMLIPIFVGMGLHEFSISSNLTLTMRRIISTINKKDAEKLVVDVLDSETDVEVKEKISKFFIEKEISLI